MAVYTSISETEASSLIQDYDLGNLISIKGISEGVTNTNYLVKTDKNSFILTIFEGDVTEDEMKYFLDVMGSAAQGGISCPEPLKTKADEYFLHPHNKLAVLSSFLQGKSVRKVEAKHCAELGNEMAKLHVALGDAKHYRKNGDLFSDVWERYFFKIEPHLDDVKRGLREELITHYENISQQWPKDLPTGIIHGDLFPDNVFFNHSKISGIIDFYYACNDFLVYDLAICLNSWCFEQGDQYNMTKGKALIMAYNQERGLSLEEMDALPTLCAGAALRFLITRLNDWIFQQEGALVKPKDPIEKLRILRFHQYIQSAKEYGVNV